jgi:hypothetical protein
MGAGVARRLIISFHYSLLPRALDKLKADQQMIGANLAVLVSTALPDSLVEFGRVDGVWVAACAPGRHWRWPCASS